MFKLEKITRTIYSAHALKRLKQRGIEEWEVDVVLKSPKYLKKSYDGTMEAVGGTKNHKIKIVFKELENYIKIITLRFA